MTTINRRACPEPEQIRRARQAAGLTQVQAADIVHRPSGTRWSEWEAGSKRMQPDTYELFLLKTGQQQLAVTTTTTQRQP